jgi:hypothetical protein
MQQKLQKDIDTAKETNERLNLAKNAFDLKFAQAKGSASKMSSSQGTEVGFV